MSRAGAGGRGPAEEITQLRARVRNLSADLAAARRELGDARSQIQSLTQGIGDLGPLLARVEEVAAAGTVAGVDQYASLMEILPGLDLLATLQALLGDPSTGEADPAALRRSIDGFLAVVEALAAGLPDLSLSPIRSARVPIDLALDAAPKTLLARLSGAADKAGLLRAIDAFAEEARGAVGRGEGARKGDRPLDLRQRSPDSLRLKAVTLQSIAEGLAAFLAISVEIGIEGAGGAGAAAGGGAKLEVLAVGDAVFGFFALLASAALSIVNGLEETGFWA